MATGTCWSAGTTWPGPDVLYTIDEQTIPGEWIPAIQAAANEWTLGSPSPFGLWSSPGTLNSISLGPAPAPGLYLALTDPHYLDGNGYFQVVSTGFDEWFEWDPAEPVEASKYGVQNVMTHEFGHWVNLHDVYDSNCSRVTMYWEADKGEDMKSTLHWRDIEGLNWQYPASP